MLRFVALCVAVLSATVLANAREHALIKASSAGSSSPGAEATSFTVRVDNVSTESTLKLSSGGTAPAQTAPVLWVVHTQTDPLFTKGQHDRGLGLESLAEDGSPARLAESLHGKPGISSVGAVAVPVGATEPGPILPSHAYEFELSARDGQRLTLAFMFGQSNDLFFAPEGDGIELFHDGAPVHGDVTSEFVLWDAGTEVNQEPGAGPDQAPRQSADNTGVSEDALVLPVEDVRDGFRYPKVKDVVRVTIRPSGTAGQG